MPQGKKEYKLMVARNDGTFFVWKKYATQKQMEAAYESIKNRDWMQVRKSYPNL